MAPQVQVIDITGNQSSNNKGAVQESTAPFIDFSDSSSFLSSLTSIQQNMIKNVGQEIITEYQPNVSGGYIILVELGPWINFIDKDERLASEYKSIEEVKQRLLQFQIKTPLLAYQIDLGTTSSSSDTYNLRHFNLPVFSYENKIDSVTVTYLETHNSLIHLIHDVWIRFINDYKLGYVDTGTYLSSSIEKNAEMVPIGTYPVLYYGAIWAYAFNPLDLTPKAVVKYIGVYPDSVALTDTFGNRTNNEHYMKAIPYRVGAYDRAIYSGSTSGTPASKITEFANQSLLMAEFLSRYKNINKL